MVHRLWSRALLSAGLALGLGLPLLAQSNATVVLTSGEQKPARNIGFFDGKELIVRTSFEEEPRFPIDQVAYIDFGGGSDRNVQFNGRENAVVMRSGRVMPGQVVRIAHSNESDQNSPYVITFRTDSGQERQFSGNDVARVYFNGGNGNVASSSNGRFGRYRRGTAGTSGVVGQGQDYRAITVSARQQWTNTGMSVTKGEILYLRTSGQISLSPNGQTASADGSGSNDPRAPLPQTMSGALIGRIGNGRPFGIGTQSQIEVPETGVLQLGINDSVVTDNDGSFRVEISR